MNMVWDYLTDKKNEGRWKIIADLIRDKVNGKVIVDLDCGVARVVKHLDGFKLYYGNDIDIGYIEQCKDYNIENTKFETIADDKVNLDEIDVLMVLGYGCGRNRHESKTLLKSFERLVKKNKPEYVVFEVIRYFERKYGICTEIGLIMATQGYEQAKAKRFIIKSRYPNCREREVSLFKRI